MSLANVIQPSHVPKFITFEISCVSMGEPLCAFFPVGLQPKSGEVSLSVMFSGWLACSRLGLSEFKVQILTFKVSLRNSTFQSRGQCFVLPALSKVMFNSSPCFWWFLKSLALLTGRLVLGFWFDTSLNIYSMPFGSSGKGLPNNSNSRKPKKQNKQWMNPSLGHYTKGEVRHLLSLVHDCVYL